MDVINEVIAQAAKTKRNDQFITSKLRAMCREGFEASLPSIVAIARGEHEDCTPAVQIRAHDNLGKYAMSKDNNLLIENSEWIKTVWMVTARYIKDRQTFVAWAADLKNALDEGE